MFLSFIFSFCMQIWEKLATFLSFLSGFYLVSYDNLDALFSSGLVSEINVIHGCTLYCFLPTRDAKTTPWKAYQQYDRRCIMSLSSWWNCCVSNPSRFPLMSILYQDSLWQTMIEPTILRWACRCCYVMW